MLDCPGSDAFAEELSNEISVAVAGTMLSAQINDSMKTKVNLLTEKYKIFSRGKADQHTMNEGVPVLFELIAEEFLCNSQLQGEIFGPAAIIVRCKTSQELLTCADSLSGQLTASIFGENETFGDLCVVLRERVGRLVLNGVPTGVRVCPSMNHGGPYPASTNAGSTAVGIDAIKRFSRFVTYQNFREENLPIELRNANSLNSIRRINGEWTKKSIE
jgi:NADP-dependent aldehyde dehydrogenase